MPKKRWIISIILIIVLILVSCTKEPDKDNEKSPEKIEENKEEEDEDDDMEDLEDDDEKNGEKDKNSNGENSDTAFEDIKIKPEEAYKIFTDEFSNAKVSSVELESEGDSFYYEVEGYDDNNKYKLKIDPMDGKILKEERDSKGDKSGQVSLEDIKSIEDLIEKAVKDAGKDFKVDEWELKSFDGKVIFEIELKDKDDKEKEYIYDVETGDLIEKD